MYEISFPDDNISLSKMIFYSLSMGYSADKGDISFTNSDNIDNYYRGLKDSVLYNIEYLDRSIDSLRDLL